MKRCATMWPLVFLLIAAVPVRTGAQAAAKNPTPQAGNAPTSVAPTAPPQAAVTGVQAEAAPQQSYTLSPAQAAKAVAYARARHELYFLDFLYGVILLLLMLQLRIAPKFRDWAARAGDNRFVQAVIFAPLFLLTLDVASLPTEIWGQWVELKFDQSIQGWGSFMMDWAKTEAIGVAIGILLIWILYAVIHKSPRRWWFYFWLASVPLIILGAIASPLIVEPLFFNFTHLDQTQPQLVARIENVVQRAGLDIPPSRIFEMNASSKLKSVNAYATGLGASKRVVVWDTTLQRMTQDEILFTLGHEIGHYVLLHVAKGISFACGVLLLFLYLGYRFLGGMIARWGGGWGIRGPDDFASLPALLLLLSVFSILFTPIENAYSRHLEHQADQYGLEIIHGIVPDAPVVAAHAFQILGEVDLEEPNPTAFEKFWFYNHPPLDERIRFAESYDPWSRGQSPEFVK